MPFPCHEYAVLKATSQGHGRVAAGERHGICELALAVQRRHVGDLPAFGLFRLPRGVPGRLSEAYQTQMQVASVKQSNVCYGRGEAYYFSASHECLYNLQHKDYDNNLVKDNYWKGIAGELHAQGKELS
jgi:hypothetical protein